MAANALQTTSDSPPLDELERIFDDFTGNQLEEMNFALSFFKVCFVFLMHTIC